MPYFDLHCHPSLRASLSEKPLGLTAWDEFKIEDDAPKFVKSFSNVIDSQSNLTQMTDGDFQLAIAVLVAVERSFARNILLRKKLPKHSPMDEDILQHVLKRKVTYYKILESDCRALIDSVNLKKDQVQILDMANSYDTDKLNLVLAVEGIHSFKGDFDDDKGKAAITQNEIDHYLANFRTFRSGKKILYVTLTHLSRERGANHAYGVKVKFMLFGRSTDEEFDDIEIGVLGTHRSFYPHKSGKGITALGKAFIEECYKTQEKEKIVLVDLKHLSWYGRKEFYQLRKSNSSRNWDKVPLIATHMGVTGTSLKDGVYVRKKPRKRKGLRKLKFYRRLGLGESVFNPWTINLFDEDIIEILLSKGLIGISLDQRIVGAGKVYEDFISPEEYNDFRKHLKKSRKNPDPTKYRALKNFKGIWHYIKNIFSRKEATEISSLNCFMNNILHVVKVGIKNDFDGTNEKVNVWDHICIGSDLDGLIDPLNKYDNQKDDKNDDQVLSDQFDYLRTVLGDRIPRLATQDEILKDHIGNLDVKINKIMLENGKSFVKKFLDLSLYDW